MEMGHGFSGWIKFGEKSLTPCWREQSRAASGLIFFIFLVLSHGKQNLLEV